MRIFLFMFVLPGMKNIIMSAMPRQKRTSQSSFSRAGRPSSPTYCSPCRLVLWKYDLRWLVVILHCTQPATTWAHGTLEPEPCAFVIIMGNCVNSTYKRLSTITLFKTSLSNPWWLLKLWLMMHLDQIKGKNYISLFKLPMVKNTQRKHWQWPKIFCVFIHLNEL